jgi:hypothetical protein
MRRLIAPAALLVGILIVAGAAVANTGHDADAKALAAARGLMPQAHWTVAGDSFDPWGSEVDYGSLQLTSVAGPSWVVELTAPGDSTTAGYQAAVVINAFTGDVTDSGAARRG